MRASNQQDAFRGHLQGFVRQFGLLIENETPCGLAIPLSDAHALMVLREAMDGTVRQKDLANALGLDKSSIARLCARLVQRGHIAQERSEADGRARELVLTAKGHKLASKLEQASKSRFGRLLDAIPMKERDSVVRALGLLNDAAASLGTKEAR